MRSFSNSLAALKKIILDSSGSREWAERIVKDHRIALENRIPSSVTKKQKKAPKNVLMWRTFLWVACTEEAMLPVQKPHLNFWKLCDNVHKNTNLFKMPYQHRRVQYLSSSWQRIITSGYGHHVWWQEWSTNSFLNVFFCFSSPNDSLVEQKIEKATVNRKCK